MTKTLTDKWRAGNLKKSFYYLKFPDTETAEIYNLYDMEKFRYVQDSEKIDVLDEVPSYDEYHQLQKRLEIATKAFEELETKSDKLYRGDNDWTLVEQLDFIKAKCQETLYEIKELEGVR